MGVIIGLLVDVEEGGMVLAVVLGAAETGAVGALGDATCPPPPPLPLPLPPLPPPLLP